MTIAENLKTIRARIDAACASAGRPQNDLTLIAVSKMHPEAAVAEALAAGQIVFGENRVQEAESKFPRLRSIYPRLRLHIIGGLQTNKAEHAVRLADTIQSLDRTRLADALEHAAEKLGRLPELFIQVNTGEEPQKSGVSLADADAFIEACRNRFGTAVTGLMCIPPVDEDPKPHFARLAALAHAHGLAKLSMGMSGDFESAIAAGATHVRVGTAIFGSRT